MNKYCSTSTVVSKLHSTVYSTQPAAHSEDKISKAYNENGYSYSSRKDSPDCILPVTDNTIVLYIILTNCI